MYNNYSKIDINMFKLCIDRKNPEQNNKYI